MLEFKYIKDQYPEQLQGFERAILREYLQHKVLQAIFESKYASKLSFLGGTALRIMHGNNRFSEDIDLDNFGLTWNQFEELILKVQRFMELEGFATEIRNVAKEAYRCYLRFPSVLYDQGLTPLREEKILIQIDTLAQGYQYEPEIMLVNRFDVFTEVRVTPLAVLLSQKIYTAVNRTRPKGRDFFDITFLFTKTRPDMGFLQEKLGINDTEQLRQGIATRISQFDFKKLSDDVLPFLINSEDIKRVEKFPLFWDQVRLE